MATRIGCLLAGIAFVSAPLTGSQEIAPAPVPLQTRTYQFEARVKDNAGITPFKVGDTISGRFTYDLRSEKVRGNPAFAHYEAVRNSFMFESGDLRFIGAGKTTVSVSSFEHSEHFGIGAPDLDLPKGWEMDHTRRSQTYGVLFQNVPPRKVISGVAIPESLSLSDFKNTLQLRLDFFHGVSFPGGAVKGRATVIGIVEKLEEVKR
jgi:hypothetical protein